MSTETPTKEKIASLQALRTFAFLGIFLRHADCRLNWPSLGVSIFFVMSGFLMMYRYYDKKISVTLTDNLKFAINKIKKLYPLHLITMGFMLLLSIIIFLYQGNLAQNILNLIFKIGLNISLTQSWVPKSDLNVSLNGVSWYLSATLFMYFMFPYIKKLIVSTKRTTLLFWGIITLLLQVVLCIPMLYIFGDNSEAYIWFMYQFPIFRLGDFFVGCIMGKIFREKGNFEQDKNNIVLWTVIEFGFAVVSLIILLWPVNIDFVLLKVAKNWTTRYILLAAGWIYLFVIKKGLFTKLCDNKVFVFLGNISAYMFLIHYVIIRYTSNILEYMDISLNVWEKSVVIIGELIVTIALSTLFSRIRIKKE
ncbi:MAG: acyltransferase [Lachnospiraceae bacterium]|nr:acyltransferase [Lachnospiraceae bacterium]